LSAWVAAAAIASSARPTLAQSQSAGFRLQPAVIDAAGAHGVGAGLQADGSLGQATAVGTSSAPHFVLQSGFWGFVGSALVPVVLAADKVPAQPGAVNLVWSGNNASYDVYRSSGCASVYAAVFAATSSNGYLDPSAPVSGLTCYSVLALAPGPTPPPAGSPAP